MKTVGSRELKNRLGRYLALVRKGETVHVTDRGKMIASLVPANSQATEDSSVLEVLKRLEAEGHLKLATKPFRKFRPVKVKGKPASQIILEERR